MKPKLAKIILFVVAFAFDALAESKNSAGDSVVVIDKVATRKDGAIFVNVHVDVTLKSIKSGSLRAGLVLGNEPSVSFFTKSIEVGRTEIRIPLTVKNLESKSFTVVVWIDSNSVEWGNPQRTLVFDKIAFDISSI